VSLSDLALGESLPISRLSPVFSSYAHAPTALADPYLSRQACLTLIRSETGMNLIPVASEVQVALDGRTMRPLRAEASLSAADLAAGRIVTLGRRIVLCLHLACPPSYAPQAETFGLLGHSDAIQAVRGAVVSVADLDVPVLIRGETGTGKELIATALAKASHRKHKPFVAINMAALPGSIALAELFGHDKGAFTGATESRKGYFGEADGGTLFLDEIGLATPDIQVALLRAIETGEVWPLGSRRPRRVDVRILAATDVDLEARAEAGGFSPPLLQRLSTVQIRLPALRERRQDIGLLFLHFLRKVLEKTGELAKIEAPATPKHLWLSADDMSQVALAPWPGNVRQLRNFATKLAVANRGAVTARLDAELLSTLARDASALRLVASAARAQETPATPAQISRERLLEALERNDFQPSRAARALGISRTTIYELIRRDPHLRKAADLSDSEFRHLLDECHGDLGQLAQRLQVSVRALQLRLSKLT